MRDFFHHSTDSVAVYLEHNGVSALVAPAFGSVDSIAYGHTNARHVLDQKELRIGGEYSFSDGNFSSSRYNRTNSANLALNANASQSSTYASYVAELAVDGNIHALQSEFATAMTTGAEATVDNGFAPDFEPWWEVDLGAEQDVGTVVLWAPRNEPTVRTHEVQLISVLTDNATAAEEADYWYTLKFAYGLTTYETSAIDFGAAACGTDGCSSVDTSGESLQAKLQELPNLWHVDVTRESVFREQTTGATTTGSEFVHVGYNYTLTFTVPVRNVPQIELGDFFDFGPNVTRLADAVNIDTVRDAEVLEMPFVAAEGDAVAHGFVMVSSVKIPDNATLVEALGMASWFRNIECGTFREQKFLTTYDGETPTTGRYVRVQLRDYHNLQLAEVEVFSHIANVVRNYHGGSPVQTGTTFISEDSLSEAFRGAVADGAWVLRIVDETDPAEYADVDGFRANEVGALNDWVLTLRDQDGNVHEYFTGISTEVRTLPACGILYKVLADGVTFEELVPVGNVQRARDRCSVRVKEHVAAAFNRVLPTEQLLYVPDADFAGRDALSFVTVLAGTTSDTAAGVDLVVKPCREQICTKVIDTISCYNPEPDCDLSADLADLGFDTWLATSQGHGGDVNPGFRVNSFDGHGEAPVDDTGDTSAQEIAELGVASQLYEDLGSGYCRSSGQRMEMCYYTSGYETDHLCASLCTNDAECQGYAFGVWPGSREGTLGMTLNSDDDDDDIESPWEQDAYIRAGTAGWCLAYTTAECATGGVKANSGLPGLSLTDSDDVVHASPVDGSSGDKLFAGCMSKLAGADTYFCWSPPASGYCDDSLELMSYAANLPECQQVCVRAASNTGLANVSGCTGIAFAASGYCYAYDSTANVAQCSHWYHRQEASIAGIDSYFIQPCAAAT